MIDMSAVHGLVQKQLFTAALAYLLDLSLFFSPLHYLFLYFLLQTRGGRMADRPSLLELFFNFSDNNFSRL